MRDSRFFACLLAVSLFVVSGWARDINLTGVVKDASGKAIENAVATLRVGDSLLAYLHTLSDTQGKFTLKKSGATDLDNVSPVLKTPVLLRSAGEGLVFDLRGNRVASATLSNRSVQLPAGIYVTEYGVVAHKGGVLHLQGNADHSGIERSRNASLAKTLNLAGKRVPFVRVKKAGYLTEEIAFNSWSQNMGTITLQRDPLEDKIDAVLDEMSTQQKIYQMTQPLVGSAGSEGALYGSVLQGGDGFDDKTLASMYSDLSSYSPKIPVTYGKDFVHGAAAAKGYSATIFPHNIGMGATRDSALVRKAAEVTAQEAWGVGVNLIFAPAISVPQDYRWGRVYEGFGNTAELSAMMGPAVVRGFQGSNNDADWRLIATAKHYLGDGGTTGGKDRGNTEVSDEVLRAVHLPGYEAVVEQGVLSVMASFNQITNSTSNKVHQHVDSLRLTGWLKTELGFDGYVIADWNGISNSAEPGSYDTCNYGSCGGSSSKAAVQKAINAGIDLAMEPNAPDGFITNLTSLVQEGGVSEARIDDAVRRILRAKFRAGLMDKDPSTLISKYKSSVGSDANRKIAREAVQKSMVLLSNDGALPLSKTAKVYLTGSHADDIANQCGGWTMGWSEISKYDITGGTTLKEALSKVSGIQLANSADDAEVILYAFGENPYAEWNGDISSLVFGNEETDADYNVTSATQLNTYKSEGKKVVSIFFSGRPRIVDSYILNSNAFVAAWLPGSEGAGITDVLFGDAKFSGKLPHPWPGNNGTLFEYGHGL
jgi:beta-glucosidase